MSKKKSRTSQRQRRKTGVQKDGQCIGEGVAASRHHESAFNEAAEAAGAAEDPPAAEVEHRSTARVHKRPNVTGEKAAAKAKKQRAAQIEAAAALPANIGATAESRAAVFAREGRSEAAAARAAARHVHESAARKWAVVRLFVVCSSCKSVDYGAVASSVATVRGACVVHC